MIYTFHCRSIQEVQLDSKIKLLDTPGVVFTNNGPENDESIALKNAIKVENVSDPVTAATAILQRLTKEQVMKFNVLQKYYTYLCNIHCENTSQLYFFLLFYQWILFAKNIILFVSVRFLN